MTLEHCPHTRGLHARGYDGDFEDWCDRMCELYGGDEVVAGTGFWEGYWLILLDGDVIRRIEGR